MATQRRYELKLDGGGRAEWTGANEEDAARRYEDAHPGASVVAVRSAEQHGLFVLGNATIIG